MGLLDIEKTSNDKLTDIKIWLEKKCKISRLYIRI